MTRSLAIPINKSEIANSVDSSQLSIPFLLPPQASAQLARMFRDPYVLEKEERVELIQQLKAAVCKEPLVPELRIVLGMALCVNFEAQPALEELRQAVEMAPDSFIARFKYAELLMRLRACSRAAEETHIAAKLASNPTQAEMARRQAATIRTMLREGVERGGLGKLTGARGWVARVFSRDAEKSRQMTITSR